MKTLIPPINAVEPHGKVTYLPFENELDLCCMVRIERDNRSIGAFLLNKGDISDETRFQVVFAFNLKGTHDQLYPEEVSNSHFEKNRVLTPILSSSIQYKATINSCTDDN